MHSLDRREKAGRGIGCSICTGCGLCPGVSRSGGGGSRPLRVLAEDALQGERHALHGGRRRLAAIDIGTTTVAMLLYNEDGSVADQYACVNPQIEYGRDVLSRISAAQDPETAHTMQIQVRRTVEKGLERFSGKLKDGETLWAVLAANTAMTYLFMGWNTEELGHAPFRAAHLTAAETEVGGVPCFVFPGISAFAGGDILAGMYACRMAESEEITLLIDLGTNGEMVLGNSRRRIACAAAAAPAFEGGAGIWGADMVSLAARLLEENILDETGLMVPEYFDEGIRVGGVLVTQQAVRNIQLAKGAIAAGTEILLEKYGIGAEQVNRVVLAGGFGYYLDPAAAARIGLFSEKLAERAVTGGNTVLSGALLAGRQLFMEKQELPEGKEAGYLSGEKSVCSKTAGKLEKICRETETINLAAEEQFQDRYLQALNFPA